MFVSISENVFQCECWVGFHLFEGIDMLCTVVLYQTNEFM
jgi:hypothetical protein